MRVLLGTTNPSKVKRFSDLLKGYDIEFITLRDIEVIEEPKEMDIIVTMKKMEFVQPQKQKL